ncbi:MAG: glyoxalase/bleomycin resistance/extradiol dioxygenase family protein [Caldimonas sp.]
MQLDPYLHFDGRCQDAIRFYRQALGAEVTTLVRRSDDPSGRAGDAAADRDAVLHVSLRIGEAMLSGTDLPGRRGSSWLGGSVTLPAPSDAEAERLFALLADGGQVTMPLTTTFFASRTGRVIDRFGVPWTVVSDA